MTRQQGLDQNPENVGVTTQFTIGVTVGTHLDHGGHDPFWVHTELCIDRGLLCGSRLIEHQALAAMGGPVLNDIAFGLGELRDGAVGPDLAEFVVECLIGHHQLEQLLGHRVALVAESIGEGTHGQALDKHLHANDFLVDLRCLNDLDKQLL